MRSPSTWRRHLLEQTRDEGMVLAQGYHGIFHLTEYSRLAGVALNDVPPVIGSRQQVLGKYRLPARNSPLHWSFRAVAANA